MFDFLDKNQRVTGKRKLLVPTSNNRPDPLRKDDQTSTFASKPGKVSFFTQFTN